MSERTDERIDIASLFETVEVKTWLETTPTGGLIGMSATIRRDRNGKVIDASIEPTGLTAELWTGGVVATATAAT